MGNYCLTRSIEDVQEYIKKIGEEWGYVKYSDDRK
jgi:hypothetical protein